MSKMTNIPDRMAPEPEILVQFSPQTAPPPPMEVNAVPVKSEFVVDGRNDTSDYPTATVTLIDEANTSLPVAQVLDSAAAPEYASNEVIPIATVSAQKPTNTPLPPTKAPLKPGFKLMRVSVPLGVAPGFIIKVAVPNEPGRVVFVRVPDNVTEFEVAYPRLKKPIPSTMKPSCNCNRPRYNSSSRNSGNLPNNDGGLPLAVKINIVVECISLVLQIVAAFSS